MDAPWSRPPPEGRWIPNRCSASTCLCDGFLADIFDPPTWDGCPHQMATGLGRRPFPTGRETEILEKAYNSAATRGRPTQATITALMRHTGAGTKEIRAWFSIARKARGHSTPSDAQSKEAPRVSRSEDVPPNTLEWNQPYIHVCFPPRGGKHRAEGILRRGIRGER